MTLAVVSVGAFFIVSEAASVNVAIPAIADDLAGPPGVQWVLTGYLLALAISMASSGWTADRYGKHRVLAMSMTLFGAATLFAAIAPSRWLLVLARVLQGLSAGAMAPVGQAYVYTAFHPSRRGLALGLWGMVATLAPALGPVIAGLLVTTLGWRWVFLANVPLIVVAAVLVRTRVPDDGERLDRPLDLTGLALAAVGFSALLLGAGNVGDGSAWPIAAIVAGAAVLAALARWSLTHPHPLFDLRMLASPIYTMSTVYVWLITVTQFAQLILIPIELQAIRGLTPLESGLVLLPAALVTAVTMPFGGRLGDSVGARAPVAIGLVLVAAAMVILSTLRPTTSVWVILGALALHGLGLGLSIMPNTLTALNSLPRRFASQAAVFRGMNRQLAAALGTAAIVAVVVAHQGGLLPGGTSSADRAVAQEAYNAAFRLSAVVALVGVVLSPALPGRVTSQRLRQARELDAGPNPAT